VATDLEEAFMTIALETSPERERLGKGPVAGAPG
jgi:hypothetical protein